MWISKQLRKKRKGVEKKVEAEEQGKEKKGRIATGNKR